MSDNTEAGASSMSMTTELAPEKLEEIRQRYTPIAAPKCHICGAEMSIGAMSASRIVYVCSGATYVDAGCHYAPGRSIADDHYAQSRVTVVDVSDPDVLALVEALEAAEKLNADYRARLDRLERKCDHQNSVYWDASNVKRCARCGISVAAIVAVEGK